MVLEFLMSTSAAAQSANRSSEPSMEEILASIRKIIADDQKALDARATVATPAAAAPVAPPPAPIVEPEEDEDILDLELATETLTEAPRAEPPRPPAPPQQPVAPAPMAAPPPPRAAAPMPSRLISDQTAGVASQSFQSLANAVFTQNARTMDDVVAEMLRPMLRSWLDENLPALVERLVKAEIERVARGGR